MFATLATYTDHCTVLHRCLPVCVQSQKHHLHCHSSAANVAHTYMHKIAIIYGYSAYFKKALGKERSQEVSVIILIRLWAGQLVNYSFTSGTGNFIYACSDSTLIFTIVLMCFTSFIQVCNYFLRWLKKYSMDTHHKA